MNDNSGRYQFVHGERIDHFFMEGADGAIAEDRANGIIYTADTSWGSLWIIKSHYGKEMARYNARYIEIIVWKE